MTSNLPTTTENTFGADPSGNSLGTNTTGGYTPAMPAEFTRFTFRTGPELTTGTDYVDAVGKKMFDLITGTDIGTNKHLYVRLQMA